MSQFDRNTTTEYVDGLRKFLNLPKSNFLRNYGFIKSEAPPVGRLPRYDEEPIKNLEHLVNDKAARAEANDTTIGERYRIARDYLNLSDVKVAAGMGVSRELVRRWGSNIHRPTCIPALAKFLGVPFQWLDEGGEQYLPANSHLGVRVGEEAMLWREHLYSLTQTVIQEIPDNASEQYAQAYLEWAAFNEPAVALATRRAGGRWQIVSNTQLFAPWIPLPEQPLTRRKWSDEVEEIIQKELAEKPTVYSAWESIKQRCLAMGLTEGEFPKRITLHKRMEKQRLRTERFGVDLNDMIQVSVNAFSNQ